MSIDIGWVNPAYLWGQWQPAKRELHLVSFVDFSSMEPHKRRSTMLDKATAVVDGVVAPFLRERGLDSGRLRAVCEAQVRGNTTAMVVAAYTHGYLKGLGCDISAFSAAEKFRRVRAWGEAYEQVRRLQSQGTLPKKEHKRLAVRLGQELLISGGEDLEEVSLVTVSDSVLASLDVAKSRRKEDDAYDAIIQLVSAVAGRDAPTRRREDRVRKRASNADAEVGNKRARESPPPPQTQSK